jgi:hypothetical protein
MLSNDVFTLRPLRSTVTLTDPWHNVEPRQAISERIFQLGHVRRCCSFQFRRSSDGENSKRKQF